MSRGERIDERREGLAAEATGHSASELAVPAALPAALPHAQKSLKNSSSALNRHRPKLRSTAAMVPSSSCGDSEGCAGGMTCPSPFCPAGCMEALHGLSNLMTGVVLNAQSLEWKLPPYSHLKRPVREISRSAQRSSELMRQLMQRCAETGEETRTKGGE